MVEVYNEHEAEEFDEIEGVAIIGLSARFAGAKNVAEFWQNLCQGRETTTFFTAEELIEAGCDPADVHHPDYVKARPMLRDADQFAAAFFNIPPREAQMIEPQQRFLLECAWEALEDAGYAPETYPGWIGVFSGVGSNRYMVTNIFLNSDFDIRAIGGLLPIIIANDRDYTSTRISYKLNLKGPSFNVQSACSTSLVAVHLACQSLLNYQCDMALAGGSAIAVPQESGYLYQEGSLVSPDGHCRPFDAQAKGTVFGAGTGIVVLKRLSDALADGDHIYAVIKGSAVNNDGSAKVGFTAPGLEGQMQVIAMAQAAADVDPATITYLEAHGTGTVLGDPIEIEALTQVFRARTDKKQFCGIGSVKGNIGHTDAAAGIANLIKTTLALKHKMLPPSINFETPNPKIDFANTPFYVNTALREWQTDVPVRRAGVSAFGIGGTNAHAILEEAPPIEPSGPSRRYQQLVLSARSEAALEAMTDNLVAHLQANPNLTLADVAFTLHAGRQAFENRRMVVCRGPDDAIAALQTRDPKRVLISAQVKSERPVVFMFSGQGAQFVNMGRDLYQQESLFREQVDACAGLLRPHLKLDLRHVLYPAETDAEQASEQLSQTALTQPALFVIEYALAQLWMSWGIKPQAMIGHSIGEYVAACLAGVFSLEDALALVAARGRLMQSMPPGAMLSVSLAEADVRPLLGDELTVATINSPKRCVVSGPNEAIAALEQRLTDQGVASRRLRTSHAFHSPMMNPILAPFEAQVRRVERHAPQIPYLSNVTGTWISPQEATDPAYWAQHLRQAVRFSDGISVLAQAPERVLLEVGPGRSLHTLAQRHPDRPAEQAVFSSLRHPQDVQADDAFLLHTLGQLWLSGVLVDWPAFYCNERRLRLSLPTYPFERQRYWIDVKPGATAAPRVSTFKSPNVADWFYVPSWKRTMPPVQESQEAESRWLLFDAGDSLSVQLAQQLQAQGQPVTTVLAGEAFAADGDAYTIHPAQRDDYQALLAALNERGQMPTHIVHLWNVASLDESAADYTEKALQRSFYSLLYLAQAIGRHNVDGGLQLTVVSSHVHKIASHETVQPEKATLLGPCKVMAQEMPNVTTRSIDIAPPQAGTPQEAQLVEQIIAELQANATDAIVAYRGYDRLVQTYEPAPLEKLRETDDCKLRPGGVYLITGGLGGIGLTLAQYLAQTVQARLVLTSRSRFPQPAAREQWLATHDPRDRTSRRIKTVQGLEALGAEVLIVQADVTDQVQMAAAVRAATERFGALHGVIHSAGLPGGGVMQLKTEQAAADVLSPKVQGARVLEAVLQDVPLDFMMLCSSVTAVTGGFGQVDYCAANAFMDAFAHASHGRNGAMTVSVNWDAWADVGMAVNTAPGYTARPQPAYETTPLDHPMLHSCQRETPQRAVYGMELSPARHWVLSDHILLGIPTVPGTTHLELARAAFADYTHSASLEIREAIFLVPMMVAEGASKEAQLILEEGASGFDFQVRSKAGVSAGGETLWQTHVMGKLGRVAAPTPQPFDLAALHARCNVSEIEVTAADIARSASGEGFLKFGPRWHTLKRVNVGHNEGLAWIELSPEFSADLEGLKLHPALLDIATSFVVAVNRENLYLPLSYKRAFIYDALPGRFYSYVRSNSDNPIGDETLTVRVTLLDEQGRVVVDVTEFTMRRVDETAASRLRGAGSEEATETRQAAEPRYRRDLVHAIAPQEGIEAFRRILFRNRLPQIVVSTRHLPTRIQQASQVTQESLLEGAAQVETSRAQYPRPNLQTPYLAPRNEVEEKLAAAWRAVLGIEQVGVHDNFFELGGDSVMGIQVVARVREAGFQVDPEQLFQNQTVAELASVLQPSAAAEAPAGPTIHLTPGQHWFLARNLAAPDHWNLSLLWQAEQPWSPTLLEKAAASLPAHHTALRLRFVQEETGWQPVLAPAQDAAAPVARLDLTALPPAEREPALEAAVAALQAGLNLSAGPLWRVALFELAARQPGRLLLVMHHLACDERSAHILLQDLATAWQQLDRGEAIQLPPPAISSLEWAGRLAERARSEAARQEIEAWLAQLQTPAPHLPTDWPPEPGFNDESQACSVSAALSAPETQALLEEAQQAYRTQVKDFLLVALGEALASHTGQRALRVDFWSQNRENSFESLDLSRTVGWLTAPCPLRLDLDAAADPGSVIKTVKEQVRRLPDEGLGCGLLPYLAADAALAPKLEALPPAQVSLRYLGPLPANVSRQFFSSHPQNVRPYLLDFAAGIVEGCLTLHVTYSARLYQRATVERLARDYIAALQALIHHCQALDTVQFTPSDFPEAGLDQATLDQFLTQISRKE